MSRAQLDRLRAGAALAAVVLAALSRGDALVLAAALVASAWRLPAVSVVVALGATSWRWGSTSLEAMAGAQTVLGPAVTVGPTSLATGTGLAAVALLMASPEPIVPGGARPVLPAAATGAAVGLVLAGSAAGGDVWWRVVVSIVAAGAAAWCGHLRTRAAIDRLMHGVAAVAAVGALLAVSRDAPGWSGTVDGAAALEGAAITAAAIALVDVGHRALTALGDRRA